MKLFHSFPLALFSVTLSCTILQAQDAQVGAGRTGAGNLSDPSKKDLNIWLDGASKPGLIAAPYGPDWPLFYDYTTRCFAVAGVNVNWQTTISLPPGAQNFTSGPAIGGLSAWGAGFTANRLNPNVVPPALKSQEGQSAERTVIINEMVAATTNDLAVACYHSWAPNDTANTASHPGLVSLITGVVTALPPPKQKWSVANAIVHELTHAAMGHVAAPPVGFPHCRRGLATCMINAGISIYQDGTRYSGNGDLIANRLNIVWRVDRNTNTRIAFYSPWHSLDEINEIRRGMSGAVWSDNPNL